MKEFEFEFELPQPLWKLQRILRVMLGKCPACGSRNILEWDHKKAWCEDCGEKI